MSDLEKLESQLQKKKIEKSLFNTITGTFKLGIDELSKTVSVLFSTPKIGKNQLTKQLEMFEDELIQKRKKA